MKKSALCSLLNSRSLAFALFMLLTAGSFAQTRISFIAIGDWGRSGTKHQDEVAYQMGIWGESKKINFVISLGDNFYDHGVSSTEDPLWQTSFENIYVLPSLYVPWYAVLGNHDYLGNIQAQIDYSSTSTRWRMPAKYFSETFMIDSVTSALFVFMDTNPICADDDESKNQYSEDVSKTDNNIQFRWLDSTLNSSNAKWKFVSGHHPVISGGYHGGLAVMTEKLFPILEKNNVDIYFCGHDHDMQHLVLGRVNFLVSGAGSSTRDCEAIEQTKFFATRTSGFLGVTLLKDSLKAEFIDKDGTPLYTTTIVK